MSNIKIKGERLKVKGLLYLLSIFIFQFSLPACSPEAKWYTDDVEITMDVHTVSAGFVECHFTTGHYTMMIKVYARDNEHLMSLVNDRIQHIEGVAATETLISLEQSISRTLPIYFDE